jgi:hypothetical protein
MMRQCAQQWQPQVIWCETSEPSRQYAPPLVHFPARTPATHLPIAGPERVPVRPGFTGCHLCRSTRANAPLDFTHGARNEICAKESILSFRSQPPKPNRKKTYPHGLAVSALRQVASGPFFGCVGPQPCDEGFRHEGHCCGMHCGRRSLGCRRRDERRSLQRRSQKGRREHFAEVKPRQVWVAGPKPRALVVRSISTAYPQGRLSGCVSVHMVLLRTRSQADCKFDLASAHGRGRARKRNGPSTGASWSRRFLGRQAAEMRPAQ